MAVDVSKLLQKAHSAMERRNYDLAIYSYKQALVHQPNNIDARTKMRIAQLKKFSEKGDNMFVGVLAALLPLVKAYFFSLTGKHEAAVLAAEDALSANPKFVPSMKILTSAAMKLGWYEVAAWQMNEILTKHNEEDVDIMRKLVEALRHLERIDEAIELCDKIREIKPDVDVDSIVRELAATQTATIYAEGARKGAHTIIKDDDERRELEANSQIARTDEARALKAQSFQRQLAERPDDYRLLLRIGDEYYDFEDFEATGYPKAKESYLKAQQIMPSDNTIKAKLGTLEIKLLTNKVKKLKQAADAGGEAEKAKLKEAYIELKRFEIKEYEERVRNQPLLAENHHKLGKLYVEAKQYDKAISEFQQSCRDPKYAIDAYTSMGQCFIAKKQADLGIDMLRKAMAGEEIFSKIRETVYFLGVALEETGQLEEALKQYTRIFEEDINYKDISNRVNNLRDRLKKEG
ncbi:MAG: hypothetical protein JXA52_05830 [Planctomycetes bacterium]|nr:hypothetical protein [Planctomycetota bacterium]